MSNSTILSVWFIIGAIALTALLRVIFMFLGISAVENVFDKEMVTSEITIR